MVLYAFLGVLMYVCLVCLEYLYVMGYTWMYVCNVLRFNHLLCTTHPGKLNAEGSDLQMQGAEAAPG